SSVEELRAGHLVAIVQVIQRMENGIGILDLDDGPVGEYASHAGDEDVPLGGAVEIVAHEKAAAEKIFAERLGLLVGEIPMPDFDAVEPWPVVDIAFVEVDRLLGGADMQAGEAANGPREVAVGTGVVDGPVGGAVGPVHVGAVAPHAADR